MSDIESAAAVPQTADAAPLPGPAPQPTGSGGLLAIVERLANSPNPNVDVIERLLAMRQREEDRLAERAFNTALSQAKGEIEPVLKKHEVDFTSDKTSKRTKYKFEEMADVARVVDPVFARYGLAYRFSIAQDGAKVSVTCILSHADGYSERMPPLTGTVDVGGTSMNPLQALGSALTYLQRYSLRAAIGVAAGRDDDARSLSIGVSPPITPEQADELTALIREVNASEIVLLRLIGVDNILDMNVDQFTRAKENLNLRLAIKRKNPNAPAGNE